MILVNNEKIPLASSPKLLIKMLLVTKLKTKTTSLDIVDILIFKTAYLLSI